MPHLPRHGAVRRFAWCATTSWPLRPVSVVPKATNVPIAPEAPPTRPDAPVGKTLRVGAHNRWRASRVRRPAQRPAPRHDETWNQDLKKVRNSRHRSQSSSRLGAGLDPSTNRWRLTASTTATTAPSRARAAHGNAPRTSRVFRLIFTQGRSEKRGQDQGPSRRLRGAPRARRSPPGSALTASRAKGGGDRSASVGNVPGRRFRQDAAREWSLAR